MFGGPPKVQGLPGVGLGTVYHRPSGAWPPSMDLAVTNLRVKTWAAGPVRPGSRPRVRVSNLAP